MALAQPLSTANAIRQKIRRLTTSPDTASLPNSEIDQKINTMITQEFPSAIKLDQLRSVHVIYTEPYRDTYPMNVNFNMGMRQPAYVQGRRALFYKDRGDFFNIYPRWTTNLLQAPTVNSGTITGATNADPTVLTADNDVAVGDQVFIQNVGGMTELNDSYWQVIARDATTITIDADSTLFGVYTSGGTYTAVSQIQNFTVPNIPFLSGEFVLQAITIGDQYLQIADDGLGNLWLNILNEPISNPVYESDYPGMKNTNLSNIVGLIQTYPGDYQKINVGTVNYVTGSVSINFTNANVFPSSQQFSYWVSPYNPGFPYAILFWNNYIKIRPVPDNIYKIELETYLTPVQLIEDTDVPILNQFWEYIAYLAAAEILRERQDFDAVANLQEGLQRQEGLVLERQGVEEIGVRNRTIFSGSTPNPGYWYGWGGPF